MKKENKGITLVALVITVIVLLILAGTAISIAINGGDIFSKSTQAKDEWNEKVAEEETTIQNIIDMMDDVTSPKTFTWTGHNRNEGPVTLEFTSGMTWGQWIESDFNPYKSGGYQFAVDDFEGLIGCNGFMICGSDEVPTSDTEYTHGGIFDNHPIVAGAEYWYYD